MVYRKYQSLIRTATVVILAGSLWACVSTGSRRSDPSVIKEETEYHQFDGREPSSLRGDFVWLNEVEDKFGRIAAESSNRAVASQNKQEILMKDKGWSFSYLPKTNHFYVDIQGTSYKMVQTKINDGERFAFAAEGQAENPITFSVTKGEGRKVASLACDTEISFWNKTSNAYETNRKQIQGKSCERLLNLLKDYVP